MERFVKGGCYVVVNASDWPAFAAMCDAAGIAWGGRREKVSEYEPAPLRQRQAIRVIVDCGKLRWAPLHAPGHRRDIPVVIFPDLKPLTDGADRAVLTSDGREITARVIIGKRTVKTTKATCSPEDTYRFGPGALLALYRALETEGDRMLAMALITEERIRQLEPEVPNIRELIGKRKHSPEEIGEKIARALSNAFGAEVVFVREGRPQRGRSAFFRMAGEAAQEGLKEGMK